MGKKNKVKVNENVTMRTIDEAKYVTLEELMRRTEYIENGNIC